MIFRDLYINKIKPFMDKDIVKVMTGIRRCGKSVMLQLIQEELVNQGKNREDMLSINFESKQLPFTKNVDDAYQYVKEFVISRNTSKVYLFFDEIQDLPGWEEMVNALMIDFKVDIYLTGSNAKMLSGELATYLGGRYIEIKIYPFSFSEVMQIYRENGVEVSEEEAFLHYITYGGMPFLYQYHIEEQPAMEYLQDVFNSIILKDVTQRNQIRDIALFTKLMMYFVFGIGNPYSASGIQKYLKSEGRGISTETIYNYIDYCKQACLLHLVPREELIGKRILQFQEKIYLTDHGIREAFYGNNMGDIGQVLENIVYMEYFDGDTKLL